MRRSFLIFGLILAFGILAFVGCSDDDDDCAACPELTQKAVALGEIELDDTEMDLWLTILASNGLIPDVDSVKIAGHLAELEVGFMEGMSAAMASYEGPAGGFDSGDDVAVNIYTPQGVNTATVTMLHEDDDEPEIIGWETSSPYDTVAIGEEIEIHWHPVGNADWYHIELDYNYDSVGTHAYTYIYDFTTDTTYTLPSSETAYNGYYYLYITPVNGPRPDATEGNVTGPSIKGRIISAAYFYFRVYVGTGDAYPVGIIDPGLQPDNHRIYERMIEDYLGK